MADFFIKNYDDLDENTIQELIEFAESRGGFFREDLKRFSIRKRASAEYLQQIFKLSDIDVQILEPQAVIDIFASSGSSLTPPREADEIIGFGKYKGQKWGEAPTEYLKWVQGSMHGYNAEIAKKVMIYRKTLEKRERESR
ncbi:MAG: hypothetical protein PF439_07005 [Helicobacteraceae bacterium]|nr:hypothetical protein [Helicobacteraceae bacterium]